MQETIFVFGIKKKSIAIYEVEYSVLLKRSICADIIFLWRRYLFLANFWHISADRGDWLNAYNAETRTKGFVEKQRVITRLNPVTMFQYFVLA